MLREEHTGFKAFANKMTINLEVFGTHERLEYG